MILVTHQGWEYSHDATETEVIWGDMFVLWLGRRGLEKTGDKGPSVPGDEGSAHP